LPKVFLKRGSDGDRNRQGSLKKRRPHHTYKIQRVYRTHQQSVVAAAGRILGKKMIRAAHVKEKQLLEELVQPPESP
jgi:hypothetical protein